MPAMNRSLILAVIVIAVLIAAIFAAHARPSHRGCWRHVYHNPHRFIGIRYYPEIGYAYRLSYRPPFYPPGELR